MSILLSDDKYERSVCEQLLAITRFIYAADDDNKVPLPTASKVMKDYKKAGPMEVRQEIQSNLDFLSVSVRYMLFDRESLEREKAKAQGGGK